MDTSDREMLYEYFDNFSYAELIQALILFFEMLSEQELMDCYYDDDTYEFSVFDAHTGESLTEMIKSQ
jgi:hypothetical protein